MIVIATIGVVVGFHRAVRRDRQTIPAPGAAEYARMQEGASALIASERKLKAFAGMAADWFWEQDADLRFTRDSQYSAGSRPTDVGKTRWDFADPGDGSSALGCRIKPTWPRDGRFAISAGSGSEPTVVAVT